MFIAMIMICGLPDGNNGCVAIVNKIPMNSEVECAENIMFNAPLISDGLPFGAFIADWKCTEMFVAG